MTLSKFVEGIQIIAKYEDPDSYCMTAEHDQFFVSRDNLPLTEEEMSRMKILGWATEDGSWYAFI